MVVGKGERANRAQRRGRRKTKGGMRTPRRAQADTKRNRAAESKTGRVWLMGYWVGAEGVRAIRATCPGRGDRRRRERDFARVWFEVVGFVVGFVVWFVMCR